MNINYIKLKQNAIIPTRATELSAGYDLYACIEQSIEIPPYKTVKIGTGLAITPPKCCFGAIFARSGLACNKGLRPANCTGVVDGDYTGEYIVALYNDSNETRTIEPNDRIAQLVFIPFIHGDFVEVENLEKTNRGSGGFGSSGK